MHLDIGRIGQIALPVTDVDRADAFYGEALGLRRLYRFGDLLFFDYAGTRLLLERSGNVPATGTTLYLRCADLDVATAELARRGVAFVDRPHLIAAMDDHDLWMTFFNDPDGNSLALMQEAPKGHVPAAAGATA